MSQHNFKKILGFIIFAFCAFALFPGVSNAQEVAVAIEAAESESVATPPGEDTPPIPFDTKIPTEPLEERMNRKITLDVREMSVIDVIRFLALKGEFNVVTSSNVQGRATFYLKIVSIKDALDIAVLSNRLAYVIENEIVRVLTAEEYEAVYGKKFNDKNVVEIIRLKYAKPSYVLATLESLKGNLGRVIIDEDTGSVVMIDTPQSIMEMKAAIQDIETPLETVVYNLQYAKADVIAEKLKARIDTLAVGSITTDERTNKLIIRAFPGRREEVIALIKSLDSPTKEVLVEARVLQVVFKPKYDYGIDWDVDFRKSTHTNIRKTSFQTAFLDEANLTSSDNLFSNFGKMAIGDFTANQFELDIRALKQVSDTKILSNPKILVTNNQEAKIHVGDTVPYIISTTSGTGDTAITSEDVRFVDVGLKLNVTPTINDDGFVSMVLKPEVSTVVGSISSKGGGIPQVNKTLVETTVLVKDGTTIVLGGLKKDNKALIQKGVPILMDIPLLNKLFSSSSESIESTEIVIFITPHIVKGDEGYIKNKNILKPNKKYDVKKKNKIPKSSNGTLQIKGIVPDISVGKQL